MTDRLTVREVSCLRLLEGGRKNKEIASQLGVAERTVSNTLQSAYRKLGVSRRQDAIAEFRRNWSETGHRLSMSAKPETGSPEGVSGPGSRPPTFYRPTPPGRDTRTGSGSIQPRPSKAREVTSARTARTPITANTAIMTLVLTRPGGVGR